VGSARTPLSSLALPSPAAETPLRLFAICTPWVVAITADRVERLLLPHEGELLAVQAQAGDPAGLGILSVGGRHYSAWDLGTLLGLGPQQEAFVLLRSPAGHSLPPMALRTGPCLAVERLAPASMAPLSRAVFCARKGALTDAFSAERARGGRDDLASIGLALDVACLWSETELESARAALGAASGQAS